MFAARREHLDKVILPALNSDVWVVCDRFSDATFAYQSGGSGLAWDRIGTLESWVQGGLQPDLTLYFDVPAEIGKARTQAVRTPDRFEQEDGSFFGRVRAGYLRRAREYPARIHIIDGTATLEEVKKKVEEIIITSCF
jgi:dTMP kinase